MSGRPYGSLQLVFREAPQRSVRLRIEDTDAERNKEEWVAGIASALTWLGINWDEALTASPARGALPGRP